MQPMVQVTVPIANIRDYGADYLPLDTGDTVAISGVATVDAGVLSVPSLQIYLQDETGGMYVNFISEHLPRRQGQHLRGPGRGRPLRGQFPCRAPGRARQTTSSTWAQASCPAANTLTLAEIAVDPESFEGTLVHIDGVSIISGTWGPDASLVISDDSGVSTINLRIDADTDVVGMNPADGDLQRHGILYQYDSTSPYSSGYRVLPRSQTDFGGVSAVGERDGSLPAQVALLPSAPNPFNARTTISFSLPQTAAVTLAVYDLQGRRGARRWWPARCGRRPRTACRSTA